MIQNTNRGLIKLNLLLASIFTLCHCKSVTKINTNYSKLSDTTLAYHFRILDSAVMEHKHRRYYSCCISSIAYLEEVSKIPASSDGTSMGKLYFTKKDWLRWHEWYDKEYGNK